MTDKEPSRGEAGLTRREVLATTSATALIGLAGCNGGDSCPDVEHNLNTAWDQSNDTTLTWYADDDDWQLVADGTNSGPVPRPATYSGVIPYFSMDGGVISFSNSGTIVSPNTVGEFVYEYCFCLHPQFENPEMELRAQADDVISELRLNGNSLSYSGNGSHVGSPIEERYTDKRLFEVGQNCLQVVVNDTQGTASDLQLAGTVTADNGDCECPPGGGGECGLTLSKDTAGVFEFGQQATYNYQVCNDGDEECTGTLEIEDDLPDGISFVSAGTGWTGTATGGVVTATNNSYGGLNPGECTMLEITVAVAPENGFPGEPPDEIENCATLYNDDELVTKDCVTHPVRPTEKCQLSLKKSTTGEFVSGEQHQAGYVYEVCNEGDAECSGELEISDPLPDGITGPVQPGTGMTGGVSGGTFEGTIGYSGLAPGECLTRELLVTVGDADAFSGDPPHEVENCAQLLEDGRTVAEDCVTHDIVDGEPCPPVAFDLNSGYDQTDDTTLGDGSDDDWMLTEDGTGTISVPTQATVVNQPDIPGNWPAPFPDSRWIAHAADASYSPPPNSTYEYEYCFCLRDGFYAPELQLRIRADNSITDIRLNGVSLGFDGNGGFQSGPIQETYDDPDHFESGENCLTVALKNEVGQAGLNVAGTMRAQNADCECEPGDECQLSLEKSTTGEFVYGEKHQAGYVYEVCNEGDVECSGKLELFDPLPDGITGPVQSGAGMTGGVTGGTFEGTIGYSGLAPGECLTRELLVTVAAADAFPGDLPAERENCATLLEGGESVSEDCVNHQVRRG